jgi:hypothetical protein
MGKTNPRGPCRNILFAQHPAVFLPGCRLVDRAFLRADFKACVYRTPASIKSSWTRRPLEIASRISETRSSGT